jgi:hypothetical protein
VYPNTKNPRAEKATALAIGVVVVATMIKSTPLASV